MLVTWLVTRNTHVKYQSSSTHCSKEISKVKVFKKWVILQGHGHKVKNNGTHRKVSSQGILKWNIKALALTVQKLLAILRFQREWKNDRQDKINMPPDLWSRGHKNCFNMLYKKPKNVSIGSCFIFISCIFCRHINSTVEFLLFIHFSVSLIESALK